MNPLANQKGFVLVVVYMVAIFVTIFAIAFFARHQVGMQATERYQNRVLAFNAAEAGIDVALRALATNSSLRSGTTSENYVSEITPLSGNAYQYTISPVEENSSLRRIDAKGCAPNCTESSRAYQDSEITVYCEITSEAPPFSLFDYGVYAKNMILMGGNSAFDSYNSNNGAYGGSNTSSEGAMAVNGTLIGIMALAGNAKVDGDVYVGHGGIPSIAISIMHATVTGECSTLSADFTPPPEVETPDDATDISINVTGNNTLTLAAGTYRASSLKTSGNGKIVTTGPVKIYVSGEVSISGNGTVVADNHPANLLIYSTESASVKISGNGAFYGGIYAPSSIVTVSGNGDIFGAVISRSYLQSGNSAVHFDLALKGLVSSDTSQTQIVRIKAWQEMNSLAWGTGS
ncbi:MAG TPA: hypothetical protein PLL75_04285 [Candidatus Omnitrophota bacterium]|nr:hypothetical protein [Candidatus Omnitrophota bacterium]HPS36928.1 hypothetical protein [Candidatus Omnitrophota bacterium]